MAALLGIPIGIIALFLKSKSKIMNGIGVFLAISLYFTSLYTSLVNAASLGKEKAN